MGNLPSECFIIHRRNFLLSASLTAVTAALGKTSWAADAAFPVVRTPEGKRKFKSPAIEQTIQEIKSSIGNKELAWMFENCFPNTLDTTVDFEMLGGKPDTYVITGDIDAMWLRDSTAQVWPYLPLMAKDERLKQLVEGVIRRQTKCVLKDPYANAFYKDENRESHWHDRTDMKRGVHERKWEVDSLCYTIRLAYGYWKTASDAAPLDANWKKAVESIVKTFRQQQRKKKRGPYSFQRCDDVLCEHGYGRPIRPIGLICSAFRPSDDATIFPFLVPSNLFAVVSLRQAAEMLEKIHQDTKTATECRDLADEVEKAIQQHAIIEHATCGRIYAFEVDGFGGRAIMDDANIPSLVSLPYLGAVKSDDPIYLATRRAMLSEANPYFAKGKAAAGLGGPHIGRNMVWPLGIIIRAITSADDAEIAECLKTLQKTHAGTGFMHESFDKNDPKKFTRPWFAWANTIFGELILKVYKERPNLLS